ncbi:MAG: RdgB/HAM1 family non-canonical purine NTP pyrophosphatase [Phycisphaeraceae bacterium]|nr:RdgB/HAM1 family non-canonical purine NTP pyrophosphatase [Phycisphaeraceae bacterium]
MNLLIATSNPHKLDELRAILAPLGIDPVGLDSVPGSDSFPEPEENADTFEGNALIKATAYAKMTNRICLADDSGLEVDALDGAPGVHSARYAGVGSNRAERDAANNAKLLAELDNIPDEQRSARFVCCICVASPSGEVLATSRGTFEGRIAHTPRGSNGFGYDPLLVLPDNRTPAELPADEKNRRSHRAAAAREIAPQLARILKRV